MAAHPTVRSPIGLATTHPGRSDLRCGQICGVMRSVDRDQGDELVLERRRAVGRWSLSILLIGALLALTVHVGRQLEPAPAAASNNPILDLLFPTTTTTAKPKPKPQTPVPIKTWLASPLGSIPTFDRPGGTQIGSAGYWYGYAQTMPIVQWWGSWVRIMLPERPNGSTAWVRRSDVGLSTTPYRVVIHRNQTNLTVFKDGYPLFTAPAGLGLPKTPTPLGHFYVTAMEQTEEWAYGPVVLDLSAHSETIQSWQGSGDAIAAIHGPISKKSDAQIGSTGTYISNGCIRLHKADSARLVDIPPGSPVDIVD